MNCDEYCDGCLVIYRPWFTIFKCLEKEYETLNKKTGVFFPCFFIPKNGGLPFEGVLDLALDLALD